MTNQQMALFADNLSERIVELKAECWAIQYWQHIDGLDVVATRGPRSAYDSEPTLQQVHTLQLCDRARAAFAAA